MTKHKYLKSIVTAAAFTAVVFAGMLMAPGSGRAANDNSEPKIQQGLSIAPVPLNLAGKNRSLVAQGSYLVNAQGGCNDCHTNPSYLTGGDPFLGQPKRVNAEGYLGGGRVFFGPVISRNLTPDKTGLPAGGAPLEEFRMIMRTGVDPDHAHPQLGQFLQVMPWPVYQDMTDNDIRAVYEYLRAIPCVEGDPGLPNPRPSGQRCK